MAVEHFVSTAPAGVWLVTAVLALSSFLFLVGYLFILYPDPVRSKPVQPQPSLAKLDSVAALEGRQEAIAADAASGSTEASIASDFSRFLQRVVGPSGSVTSDTDIGKLRPFRAFSFLLVTVPASFVRYRRKMAEENLGSIRQ